MAQKDLMNLERFKRIMNTLIAFRDKRDRVSDFFEAELTEDSWCIFTYGNELETTLINMLADEFNCWFYIPRCSDSEDYIPKNWWQTKHPEQDNDISYWLYELDGSEKNMIIDGKLVPVNTLEEFYNYLIKYYE